MSASYTNDSSPEGWIDPWLDEEKLLPGQDWDVEIEKAVEAADAILVCLSSTSVSKEGYVQKEIKVALNIALFKPEETIFIVPMRINDCLIPRNLRSIQYIDYFPKERKEWARSRLLQALKLRLGQIIAREAEEHARKEEQLRKELGKKQEETEVERKVTEEKASRKSEKQVRKGNRKQEGQEAAVLARKLISEDARSKRSDSQVRTLNVNEEQIRKDTEINSKIKYEEKMEALNDKGGHSNSESFDGMKSGHMGDDVRLLRLQQIKARKFHLSFFAFFNSGNPVDILALELYKTVPLSRRLGLSLVFMLLFVPWFFIPSLVHPPLEIVFLTVIVWFALDFVLIARLMRVIVDGVLDSEIEAQEKLNLNLK